jgi:hypothetical protein
MIQRTLPPAPLRDGAVATFGITLVTQSVWCVTRHSRSSFQCSEGGVASLSSCATDGVRIVMAPAWSHPGLFEGEGVSTSRVSPPAPLSISYGHVGCLKARAFPPPV